MIRRDFATRAAASAAAADLLAQAAARALAAGRRARLALSGGSTPQDAYRLLAAAALDWARVDLALVDERCVPADHPASNEGLLRRVFGATGATIHPMTDDGAARQAAYRTLRPFDAALLGMGVDGHVASWFPGAEGTSGALDPSGAATLAAVHAPGAAGASARVTLTLPAVAECRTVCLLLFGTDKKAVVDRAVGAAAPSAALPVAIAAAALGPRLRVFWAP